MDERLKFLLLLNYVNANSQALTKFAALGVPWRELWNPPKIDAAATVFTEKQLARIREAELRAWAENEAERAAKLGARIISIDDEDYPARLLDLRDAPLVLYVRGRLNAKRQLAIRMLGNSLTMKKTLTNVCIIPSCPRTPPALRETPCAYIG